VTGDGRLAESFHDSAGRQAESFHDSAGVGIGVVLFPIGSNSGGFFFQFINLDISANLTGDVRPKDFQLDPDTDTDSDPEQERFDSDCGGQHIPNRNHA